MPTEHGQSALSDKSDEMETYHAPRVVELGSTSTLIRGYWTVGSWDYNQSGSHIYYITGE